MNAEKAEEWRELFAKCSLSFQTPARRPGWEDQGKTESQDIPPLRAAYTHRLHCLCASHHHLLCKYIFINERKLYVKVIFFINE